MVSLQKKGGMVNSSFQTWEALASEISGFSREKIHRGWNEQKLGSSLKQPAEQTTAQQPDGKRRAKKGTFLDKRHDHNQYNGQSLDTVNDLDNTWCTNIMTYSSISYQIHDRNMIDEHSQIMS